MSGPCNKSIRYSDDFHIREYIDASTGGNSSIPCYPPGIVQVLGLRQMAYGSFSVN